MTDVIKNNEMENYFKRLLNIYKGVIIAVLVVLAIIVAFSPIIIGVALHKPSLMLLLFITIPVTTALISNEK